MYAHGGVLGVGVEGRVKRIWAIWDFSERGAREAKKIQGGRMLGKLPGGVGSGAEGCPDMHWLEFVAGATGQGE